MKYPSEEPLNIVTCRKFRFKLRRIRNGGEEKLKPKLGRFENIFFEMYGGTIGQCG
jgi:hypothetical protein